MSTFAAVRATSEFAAMTVGSRRSGNTSTRLGGDRLVSSVNMNWQFFSGATTRVASPSGKRVSKRAVRGSFEGVT